MPSKYQAQVKMTPEAKPSPVRTEAATLPGTAPASNETILKRPRPSPVRPVNLLSVPRLEHVTGHNLDATAKSGNTRIVYEALKRVLDFVAGLVLLTITIPLIFIAAVLIRAETKGSPIFVQTRLGQNGKPFKIFKLRGMFIDARKRFADYYDYSQHRDLEFCFHHQDDPRVTRAGKFIRRTSIDELPNLWNVILGDMSLVGPRPEIPEVMELYGPYRDEYLSVKPGVTCLSKCTGRDRLTKKETIEFDLGYVRARSFRLDVRILWKTFCSVVLRRDVF